MVIHSRKLWKTLLEVPTEQQCKTPPYLQLLLTAALPAVPGAPGALEHTAGRRSTSTSPTSAPSGPRAQRCRCQGPGAAAVLALSYSRSLRGHLGANHNMWAPEPGPAAVGAALLGGPTVGSDHASPGRRASGDRVVTGVVARLSASPALDRGHRAAPSH